MSGSSSIGLVLSVAGCLALATLGVAVLLHAVRDIARARSARHWPVARGQVICSFVNTTTDGENSFDDLAFEYRYVVDDVPYIGERISAAESVPITFRPGWSTARFSAGRYPAGTEVAVRYNPLNPSECCLEAGGFWGVLLVNVPLGLLLILVSARMGMELLQHLG